MRQLAVRARRHVDERRPRFEASREQRDELADRFLAAAQEGELAALEALLAEDVELHGDGGGKAPALARPVHWPRPRRPYAARMVEGGPRFGATSRRVEVNGQPGAMFLDPGGKIISVLALDIADGQIQAVERHREPRQAPAFGRGGERPGAAARRRQSLTEHVRELHDLPGERDRVQVAIREALLPPPKLSELTVGRPRASAQFVRSRSTRHTSPALLAAT